MALIISSRSRAMEMALRTSGFAYFGFFTGKARYWKVEDGRREPHEGWGSWRRG